jgi:phosphoglycolate phosphatase
MTIFPFPIVGFDLDGTLLDTSIELAASLNHALASIGRAPIDRDDVRCLVGMGAPHMLALGLQRSGGGDDALVKQLIPVLIAHYEAHLGSNCPPFPGLLGALDLLAAHGVKLAVVTNKYEHLARKLLTKTGMIDRFVTVIGGDTLGPGRSKPAPDPILEMMVRCGGGRTAFVGDSSFDIDAANAARATSIAVSFGFLNQPVASLDADHIIDHYDELMPLLAGLAEGERA